MLFERSVLSLTRRVAHNCNYKNMSESERSESTRLELERLATRVAELESRLSERDSYIASIRHDMAMLERSVVWKAVRVWAKMIDITLPYGTRRRRAYDAGIHAMQDVLNESLPDVMFGRIKRKQVAESAQAALKRFTDAYPSIDVLVVNHEDSRTGAPMVTFEVAQRLRDQTLIVAIASLDRGTMTDEVESRFGPVIRPNEAFAKLPDSRAKAKALIETCKPRVVYASSITSLPYAEAAKEAGIPTVFHVHELKTAFQFGLSADERGRMKNAAHQFIVPSSHVKAILVNELGCDAAIVTVVPSSVNVAQIHAAAREIERSVVDAEIGGDASSPIVLAVGTFNYRKGADLFVKMAEILREKKVRARFAWIGGKLPAKDTVSIDLRGREQSFTFLHERKNPHPFIAAAHVVVVASREDPMPLAAIEAAAHGVPVVCFADGGGTAEAFGDACIAVPGDFDATTLANAVEQTLTDTSLHASMKIACARVARTYDMHQHLPRTVTAVQEALQNNN